MLVVNESKRCRCRLGVRHFLASSAAVFDLFLTQMDTELETLVREQAAAVLVRCGMADKLRCVNDFVARRRAEAATTATTTTAPQQQQPSDGTDVVITTPSRRPTLPEVPGMDPASLSASLQGFYTALGALSTFGTPALERLIDPGLRAAARAAVSRLVCNAYETLCQVVITAYPQHVAAAILIYSPLQVRAVLGVNNNVGITTPPASSSTTTTTASTAAVAAAAPSSSLTTTTTTTAPAAAAAVSTTTPAL